MEYAKQEKDMHDGRVQQMESWLMNKKLNEAYRITQLRDNNQHDEAVRRDMEQHQRSNAKSYRQWMNHCAMQSQIDDMERAHRMQMEHELMMREEAQRGIQQEINQMDGYDMESDDEEEPAQNFGGHQEYNPLRQKQY